MIFWLQGFAILLLYNEWVNQKSKIYEEKNINTTIKKVFILVWSVCYFFLFSTIYNHIKKKKKDKELKNYNEQINQKENL